MNKNMALRTIDENMPDSHDRTMLKDYICGLAGANKALSEANEARNERRAAEIAQDYKPRVTR